MHGQEPRTVLLLNFRDKTEFCTKRLPFIGVLSIAIDASLLVLKGPLAHSWIGDFMWGPDLVDNMVFCGGICCLHLTDNWFLYLYVGDQKYGGIKIYIYETKNMVEIYGGSFFQYVM